VDVSTAGCVHRHWDGCFKCGADVSTAGCVHQHWDGRFDCGAGILCGADISTAVCVAAAWNATQVEEVNLLDFEGMLTDDVDTYEWDKADDMDWNSFELQV